MAKEFVLTSRLKVNGPPASEINAIRSSIATQLSQPFNINLKFAHNSLSSLDSANSKIKTLQNTLAQLKGGGSAITSSINQLNSAVASTARTTKQATTSQKEFNSSMEQFGHLSALAIRRNLAFTLTAVAVYGISRAFKGAIGEAIAFDREMIKLRQLSSESDVVLRGVQTTIDKLSIGLGVSSNALIKVSDILVQAGYNISDTKMMLEALAKTTLTPTFGEIGKTTEGLIAILHQFNLQAYQSEAILGSINKVAADYAIESSDMIEAAKRSGSIFAGLGGNFNEFLGILTAVRSTTRLTAETIATGLNTIFVRLQRPTTVKMLEDLGIQIQDVNEQGQKMFVGPMEAIRRIGEGMKNINPRTPLYAKTVEEIAGIRQYKILLPLLQQRILAEEAMQVSMSGTSSLSKDVEESQKALAIQFARVGEEFLAMTRKFVQSDTFHGLATGAMTLARSIIAVVNALQDLAPLLAVLGSVSLLNAGQKFFGGRGFLSTFVGKKANSGGLIPGTGNTDTVPALLTPGEFVIRKSAVRALGLTTLNNMNRYAQGGLVTGGRHNYGITDDIWNRLKDMRKLKSEEEARKYIEQYSKSLGVNAPKVGSMTEMDFQRKILGAGGKTARDLNVRAMYDEVLKKVVINPAQFLSGGIRKETLRHEVLHHVDKLLNLSRGNSAIGGQIVDIGKQLYPSNSLRGSIISNESREAFAYAGAKLSNQKLVQEAISEAINRQQSSVSPTQKAVDIARRQQQMTAPIKPLLTPGQQAAQNVQNQAFLQIKKNEAESLAKSRDYAKMENLRNRQQGRLYNNIRSVDIDQRIANMMGMPPILPKRGEISTLYKSPYDRSIVEGGQYSRYSTSLGFTGSQVEPTRDNSWRTWRANAMNRARGVGRFLGFGRATPTIIPINTGGVAETAQTAGAVGRPSWGGGGRAMLLGFGASMLAGGLAGNVSNESPRTKGGLNALATGLSTSASIAMMSGGNPYVLAGAVVAGFAHGVYAYTKSINESNEALKKTKIERSFQDLNKYLEDFRKTGKLGGEGGASLQQAIMQSAELPQEYMQKKAANTILSERVSGVRGTYDLEEGTRLYAENKDRLAKSGTLDVFNRDIERRIATGNIKSFADLGNIKDASGKNVGGAYKEAFLAQNMTPEMRAGADALKLRGFNTGAIDREIFTRLQKNIVAQAEYGKALVFAHEQVRTTITDVEKLADSFSYINNIVDNFDNNLENLANIMSTTNKAVNIGNFGSNALRYSNVNQQGALGVSKAILGNKSEFGQQAIAIKSILPGIIEQLGQENKLGGAESTRDTAMELESRLSDRLKSILPGQNINNSLIRSVVDNIQNAITSDRQSSYSKLADNPQEIARKGTEGLNNFNDNVQKIATEIEKSQQKLAQIVVEYDNLRNAIIAQRDKNRGQNLQFVEMNRRDRYGLGLSATQYITPQETAKNFAARQRDLGVTPGNELNTEGILAQIRAAEIEKARLQSRLSNPSIQYGNQAEANKDIFNLQSVDNQLKRFNQALENCANSTDILSAIQNRLGELDKARSSAFQDWMGNLGMTLSERRKVEREDEVLNRVLKSNINPESLSIIEQNMFARAYGRKGELRNPYDTQGRTIGQTILGNWNLRNPFTSEEQQYRNLRNFEQQRMSGAGQTVEGRLKQGYDLFGQGINTRQAVINQMFDQQQFSTSVVQMNSAANTLAIAVNNWTTSATDVATKLASVKDMTVSATHQVNVNITGLAGMTEGLEKMVTDAVNKALGAKNSPLNADKPTSIS